MLTDTQRLPVTLVSGFLGVGKTTLLNSEGLSLRREVGCFLSRMSQKTAVAGEMGSEGRRCGQSRYQRKGLSMAMVSVIVLSGFFGSGKTSVLNHLLRRRAGRRTAVIMNDLREICLDPDLLDTEVAAAFQEGESLSESADGCSGCSVRQELIEAVGRLARDGCFDQIVVECSGMTDPLLVTDAFELEDTEGRTLSSVARLDHLITVVDARHFRHDYESGDTLRERGMGRGVDDERSVPELLANQVECSTTLVLNKVDLVSRSERRQMEHLLQYLNPDANIVSTLRGNITMEQLGRATEDGNERDSLEPGWMKLLSGSGRPQEEVSGVQAFVYRARRPFHPARFWTLMQEAWPGVLRSKGYFWLASQPRTCYMWSQAGGACLYERLGRWWVAIADRQWPKGEAALQELRKVWDLEFGDRRIELALIGEELDQGEMTGRLDACLLTRDELALDEELWRALQDPFRKPSWEKRHVRTISGESFH